MSALTSADGTASGVALAHVSWTDADIRRFIERQSRLLRWGWPEPDAEQMAECLVQRDRDADDRVCCVDCTQHRPGRCGNHRAAGLWSADVGRDLARLLQRCPGFMAVAESAPAQLPGRDAGATAPLLAASPPHNRPAHREGIGRHVSSSMAPRSSAAATPEGTAP